MWHEGAEDALTFIATLSPADSPDWAGVYRLPGFTSRVSPDGHWVTLMSDKGLTGYDNHDANSGEPDEEVFIYGADSGRLTCASCDPSGARPVGGLDAGGSEAWTHQWVAASIPTWTEYAEQSSLHQSRFLSNNGRLFFDSIDPLVPGDINGRQDVYEWEPDGEGSCHGAPGCTYLISGGTGTADSEFVDASDSGDDVFFLTRDRLVAQDVDTNYDIYDARVCTSAEPCPAQQPSQALSCDSGDACKPAPTPQPAIFGQPSSATTFSSAGPSPARGVGSRPLTRAQMLAKALKACRAKKSRRRRTLCESAARRRYGPEHEARKTNRRPKS